MAAPHRPVSPRPLRFALAAAAVLLAGAPAATLAAPLAERVGLVERAGAFVEAPAAMPALLDERVVREALAPAGAAGVDRTVFLGTAVLGLLAGAVVALGALAQGARARVAAIAQDGSAPGSGRLRAPAA